MSSAHLPPVGTLAWEAGACSIENKVPGSKRTSNEDRYGAFELPVSEAHIIARLMQYMYQARIVPDALRSPANGPGSTLSMVAHADDGRVVCGFVGDSPILMVSRNKDSGEVSVKQFFLPHNIRGLQMREVLGNAPKNRLTEELETQARQRYSEGIKPVARGHTKEQARILYRNIQKSDELMGMLELQAFRPQDFIGADSEYLGMLVCSDGVNKAVSKGAAERALSDAMRLQDLSPNDIAQTVVKAAAASGSKDNITAIFLPAGAAQMAVVADGNLGGAGMAEKVIRDIADEMEQVNAHAAEGNDHWKQHLMQMDFNHTGHGGRQ